MIFYAAVATFIYLLIQFPELDYNCSENSNPDVLNLHHLGRDPHCWMMVKLQKYLDNNFEQNENKLSLKYLLS